MRLGAQLPLADMVAEDIGSEPPRDRQPHPSFTSMVRLGAVASDAMAANRPQRGDHEDCAQQEQAADGPRAQNAPHEQGHETRATHKGAMVVCRLRTRAAPAVQAAATARLAAIPMMLATSSSAVAPRVTSTTYSTVENADSGAATHACHGPPSATADPFAASQLPG